MRARGALAVLGAAALAGCGASSFDGSGRTAPARSAPPPLFAAYAIAGGGEPVGLPSGEGVATLSRLGSPAGVAVAADGSVLVADRGAHRIRRIDEHGRISVLAGTGRPGFGGDGGSALAARLRAPSAVAARPDGSVLVADTGNHRIRLVTASGSIETVAGCGRRGRSGDGGRATRACLAAPRGVAALPGGGFLIADTGNHRIRRVTPRGAIGTVAGRGRGFGGDGRSALRARLRSPRGVAALAAGGFAVADTGNRRVRRVTASGIIETVAGGGRREPDRELPAARAFLGQPVAVAPDPRGGLLIADEGPGGFAVFAGLYRLSQRTLRPLVTVEGVRGLLGAVGPAQPAGVATAADGSVVLSDRRDDRLLLLAPREAGRIAVRFAPAFLGIEEDEPLRALVLATRAAEVEFQVVRDGAAVARGRFTVVPGRSSHTLLERTDEGRYRVELVARDGDGVFTDALRVGVSGGTRYAEPVAGA